MSAERSVQSFGAGDYRELLASGQADVVEFYDRHLASAKAADEQVRAFASLDDRVIRLQAEHLKAQRARGDSLPALYGVPIAVKDIIDTIDFPTAYGSPIHEGRYAVADATVVRRLRDAGAVIYGKTVTTEFATFHPGPTRNPHDLAHTPGGSSSGSAAAVAAGIVPVALGSQTNGSVVRPASFCGVYGFKPSAGVLPRTGSFEQSPSLDQLGVFARSIEGLALVAEIMAGDDGHDAATRGIPPRRMHDIARSEPPLDPKFCFVRTPWWDRIDEEARLACEEFLEAMDGSVSVVELPSIVEQAVQWHRQVHEPELAFALQREYRHHPDKLSDKLREQIERGIAVPVVDYLAARERMPHVSCAFDEFFEHFDAILTPATLGAAPKGLASTGNPIMQTVWTFAGLPSLNLPLFRLSGGLPFGIQAVGRLHDDARMLRACRWLVNEVNKRSAS
ncbi:amidase [Burkholderiaceae bacterium FT117]|uniref:amidase n=1 Tax=Zeimonas sediminis TaxID=2944268 RepID=UPI0023430E5E|nr:amidase [Zeimonas sediminis]MCM5571327.1 amidase [Zeimonas sediminis]